MGVSLFMDDAKVFQVWNEKKKLISMTHKEIVDVDFKSMCLYKFL